MGMFGGGFANKLGQVGDILTGNPVFAKRQEQEQEAALKQSQIEIARYKALHPDPTGTMQNAAAGGLVPGTPEYQRWVLENGGRPGQYFVLGNSEGGQQIVSPNAGAVAPATGAPQAGAIQDGYRYLGGDPSLPSSWQKAQ